jgi:hypothetical protein
MKRLILNFLSFAIACTALLSPDASFAQRRAVVVARHPVVVHRPVVVRGPVVHRRLVVRPGHPIRRVLPAAVVYRPARTLVTVRSPLVYLPAVTWRSTVVTLPARERLVWQDSETITRDEEWVDTNFGIDRPGNALYLDIDGKTKLNFAEVTFAKGNVQVVDFNEQTHGSGICRLLDFSDGRHVSTVRLLARSESDDTKLTVYLSK